MAGNWLKKISAGDKWPFSAAFHNATADVLEAFARSGSFGKNGLRFAEGSQTRVRVRNDTGGDRDTFDVVQLSDPIFTPTDNLDEYKFNASFKAVAVEADTEKYAVLLESLPQNDYGWAMVAGCGVARVNFASADIEDEEHAKAGDDAAHFEEDGGGSVHVVWREGIEGEQWAWVCFEGGAAVKPVPEGSCDCCPGCICYPDVDHIVTACAAGSNTDCAVERYTVIGSFPFTDDSTLTHDTGCIWLSDSFNVTICGVDYGLRHWKLTVAANEHDSKLELINDGTGAAIALEYRSLWWFNPICSNEFRLKFTCDLPEDTAHTFPKVICIKPVGAPCEPCPEETVDACQCTGVPTTLNATITGCISGTSVMDYYPGQSKWIGQFTAVDIANRGCNYEIVLVCQGGSMWQVVIGPSGACNSDGCGATDSAPTIACGPPFSASGTVTVDNAANCGAATGGACASYTYSIVP